ncbi:MAG: hypothetical protein JEY91_07400 [Spirochaetaceae bacterium]|nr:hypothetical protein [Spirochaetaceae bacterium]
MNERIGEWMIVEGLMNYQNVMAVLEFQEHGSRKKFGQIAVNRHLISGKDLKYWETTH